MDTDAGCEQVVVRVNPEALRAGVSELQSKRTHVLSAKPLSIRGPSTLVLTIDRFFREESELPEGATRVTLRRALRYPGLPPINGVDPSSTSGARHLEMLVLEDGTLWATCWLRHGGPAPATMVTTFFGRQLNIAGDASPPPTAIHLPRTAGLLMAGRLAAWEGLHVAIVGCGRTGSILADALCAQGIRRLTLVDHDVLERGNLDGMALVSARDVGRPKVEAVGSALCHRFPEISVTAVASQFPCERSLCAVAPADVLVTSIDRDRPRLHAAHLARQMLMLHLDIGTGPDGLGAFAADIRLTMPRGLCLLCLGGVADTNDRGSPRPGTSSRVINAAAAHLACQALVNAMANPLPRSDWWRVRAGGRDPIYSSERLTPEQGDTACPWCAGRMIGSLGSLAAVLRTTMRSPAGYAIRPFQ